MKLRELMALMSYQDGRELYCKVEEILKNFGVDTCREDGMIKNLYEVCCDVAEVVNNNTK